MVSLETAMASSTKMVARPNIVAEFADSRNLDNLIVHSSSEYYSKIALHAYNPTLYWSFRDIFEDVVSDLSGNSRNGTVNNEVFFGTSLLSPSCLDGDDENSSKNYSIRLNGGGYIEYVSDSDTILNGLVDDFVVSCWAKSSSVDTTERFVISKRGSTSNSQHFYIKQTSGDKWEAGVFVSGSATSIATTPSIVQDDIYHLVLVMRNQVLYFYVNGSLVNSSSVGSDLNPTGTNSVFVGKTYSGGNFIGEIDEVEIYDYVLFPDNESVQARYFSGSKEEYQTIEDTFTRSNSTSNLGSTEVNEVEWEQVVGTWGISSNEAYMSADGSGSGSNIAVIETGYNDGITQFTVRATPTNGTGLVFRYQDINNFLRVQASTGFATWNVYKVVNGVQTLLGNLGSLQPTGAGTVCKVVSRGNVHKFYLNDVFKVTYVVNDLLYGTKRGLHASDASATTQRWDNFYVEIPEPFGYAQNFCSAYNAFDGINKPSYLFSFYGQKDIDGNVITANGEWYPVPKLSANINQNTQIGNLFSNTFQVGESFVGGSDVLGGVAFARGIDAVSKSYDTQVFDDRYKFPLQFREKSNVTGDYASNIPLVVANFDQRPATHIDIWTGKYEEQVDLSTITLHYKNTSGTWVAVTLGTVSTDGDYVRCELNDGNPVDIKGVKLLVNDTVNNEAYPVLYQIGVMYIENISGEIIDFSIDYTKENFDSSVPIGVTAANDSSIVVNNTHRRYNPNGTSDIAPYLKTDIKMDIKIGYQTGSDPTNIGVVSNGIPYVILSTTTLNGYIIHNYGDTSATVQLQSWNGSSYDTVKTIEIPYGMSAVNYDQIAFTNRLRIQVTGADDVIVGHIFINENSETIEFIDQGIFWVDEWGVSDEMSGDITLRDESKFLQEDEIDPEGIVFRDIKASNAIGELAKWSGVPRDNIDIVKDYVSTISETKPLGLWRFRGNPIQKESLKLSGIGSSLYSIIYMDDFNDVPTSQITIEFTMLIESGAPTSTMALFQLQDETATQVMSASYSGSANQLIYSWDGGDSSTINVDLEDNMFHHHAITWDMVTGAYVAYIDAIQVASGTIDAGNPFTSTTGVLILGGAIQIVPDEVEPTPNIWRPLSARMADVTLWKTVRTQAELEKTMTKGKFGDDDIVFSYWLNDQDDAYAYNAANGYHRGKMIGDFTWETDYLPYNVLNEYGKRDATYTHDQVAIVTNGVVADQFDFDGTKYAYIPAGSAFDLTNLASFVFFINQTDATGTQFLIAKEDVGSTTTGTWKVSISGGNITLEKEGTGTVATTGAPISLNTDHCVIITFDQAASTEVNIYVDGVSYGSGNINSNFTVNDELILIGREGAGNGFIGTIKDVSIHDRVLTAAEINKIVLAGLNTNTREFSFLYSSNENVWDAMLKFATPDLGTFSFFEDGTLKYKTLEQFYLPVYTEQYNSQFTFDGDAHIISGDQKIELQANIVEVKVYSENELNLTKYESVWNADEGESLGSTNLTAKLDYGDTSAIFIANNGIPWPSPGYVAIGDEIIKYNEWREDIGFLGLERGLFGSLQSSHGNTSPVNEVRVYKIEFSDPIITTKYPFSTAVDFDDRAYIWSWQTTPFFAELIIVGTGSDGIVTVLEGDNPVTGLVNFLSIAGIPFKTGDVEEINNIEVFTYNDSFRKYRKKKIIIDNEFISSRIIAKDIADKVVAEYADPIPIIDIETIGIPTMKLDNRVTVTNFAQLNLTNQEYFIIGKSLSYDGGVTQTFILRKVAQ